MLSLHDPERRILLSAYGYNAFGARLPGSFVSTTATLPTRQWARRALEIDRKLNRRLHWEVGRFLALERAVEAGRPPSSLGLVFWLIGSNLGGCSLHSMGGGMS